jgi:hypothetical protein
MSPALLAVVMNVSACPSVTGSGVSRMPPMTRSMHPVHRAALTDVSSVCSLLPSLPSAMTSPESALTVSSWVLGVAPDTM